MSLTVAFSNRVSVVDRVYKYKPFKTRRTNIHKESLINTQKRYDTFMNVHKHNFDS